MKKFVCIFILLLLVNANKLAAQKIGKTFLPNLEAEAPHWIQLLYADTINWIDLQTAYENYYATHKFEKSIYTQYYKRWMLANDKYKQDDGSIVKFEQPIIASSKVVRGPNSDWKVIGPLQTFNVMPASGNQIAVPTQVNIYSFDVAASNPSIMYAAPESGGIFKSIDKGLNWISVTDTISMFNILAIAVHPTNPNIVYAGGYDKVYKTINGGASWVVLNNTANLGTHDLAIVPSNPNIIFHAGDLGLQVSTNSGATWATVSAMNTPVYDIEINHLNNNSIYVLKKNNTTSHSEFWRSTNMGTSFSNISNGWNIGTDNGGRLGITEADTNRIYAVLLMQTPTQAPAIMKSVNGGGSWTTAVQSTVTGLTGDNSAPIGMSNGQGFYDLSVVVNNNNADELIVGTTSIYKSVDGGSTYNRIGGYGGSFSLHPDVQEMKMIGNDAWIATDGGIIFSSDFFSSTSNYDARVNGIYGSAYWGFGQGWNEDILCGGRYHNGNAAMYQSYPAGKALSLGGGEAGTGFVMLGKERHVAHSDLGGRIIPSTFTGTDISSFSLGKYPNEDDYGFSAGEMEFQNDCYNYIYITKDSSLWKSIDGGGSFTEVHKFTSRARKFEVCRSNPAVIYLATNTTFYKSIDTGNTWSVITLPTGTSASRMAIAVSHTNANTFWITNRSNTSNNKVHKSIDGGNSFINLTSPLINPFKFYTIVHQAGSDGGVYLFAENMGTVFYTNNTLGTAWVDFSSKLPRINDPVSAKAFYRDSKMRTAGSRGIWEIDFYEEAPPIAQPTVDKLFSNCPKDTFYFDDFSTLNHANASWQWSFAGANYISNYTVRNPKVTFPTIGTYGVTLKVTNANGQSSTKSMSVNVLASECEPDTTVGGALNVNGGYNQFAASSNLSAPNVPAFTIMAWIKGNGVQNDYAGIFGIDIGNNASTHLNVRSVGIDSTEIGYHHPNGQWWYSSGLYLKPDEWTNVALVVEPTQISIYKNGIKATHTGLTIPPANLGNIKIGTMITREYDRCFAGEIDEVAVYTTALSTNDIRDMMHLTKQNPNYPSQANTNLLAYYQFNELVSYKVFDKKGSAHAGLVNASRVTSSAPIGGGTSLRINNINTSGNYTFGNTNVSIDFANGVLPTGDVVVSKLNVLPDNIPTGIVAQKRYYVVNNYGANFNFNTLNKMVFGGLPNFIPSLATNFELYKRNWNAHGPTWGGVHDVGDTFNANANNSTLEFSINNNISNFGQFYFTSKIPVSPLAATQIVQEKFSFVVYPNPTKNVCYLKVQNPNSPTQAFVNITSTVGTIVKTSVVQLSQGFNNILLPLSNLAHGVYTVSINRGGVYAYQQLIIE